ncbi:hypothetical protein [Oceanirhabdus seepicola]|uniref:Phospholipase/carboxylesterase/thioesterase domain-containing protein n=1 Tax=Oceanirhabdus seepicola TaxID=2828781 RepID=A0A9J6P7Q3_9CLOT|nr:hypothetical protein [Oceanirhabdus seepicola]MCM1991837.1 hypothetical protein [Oceanirhabdus seepicola]
MLYNSFKELEKDYSIPYIQGKYKEALNLLEKGMKSLPEEEIQKYLFDMMIDKARLYTNIGMYEECFDTILYLVNKGFTCPLHWSRFNPLEEDTRFKKLKEKNNLLRKEIQEKSKFEYIVYLPHGYNKEKKYPLFFNLHGDGENIQKHMEFWKPEKFHDREFIVVYIQSSQVSHHNGYAWEKRGVDIECYDSAYREIKKCYDDISNEYSIDEKSIIIGGFSGGATASIDIVMNNSIPLKGFISLCSEKPKSFTKENVEKALHRGVKGVFMEGKEDLPMKEVEEMMKGFKDVEVPYEYYINDGIGHWYPEDLNDKLEQAIDFILK